MTEKHPGTISTSESIAPENTQPWPSRRKARATALEVLYETDCSRHDPEGILNYRFSDSSLQRPVEEHARKLVEKVLANKGTLDEIISTHAPSWPVDQMAVVDRNLLRVAMCEILMDNNVPTKVAINEAVDLAKFFGSDGSPGLINGVLGSLIDSSEEEL